MSVPESAGFNSFGSDGAFGLSSLGSGVAGVPGGKAHDNDYAKKDYSSGRYFNREIDAG